MVFNNNQIKKKYQKGHSKRMSFLSSMLLVFFDIYLQNGLLGVISYLLCIFVTLKKKGKWESSNLAIFIMIVSFIFIFYNSVGIVFTKARSGIGLLQWAIIALMYVCKKNESIKRSVAYDKSYSRNLQCQRIR